MKKIILLAIAASALSACTSMSTPNDHQAKVGMANPASQYCAEQGGKIEIKDEKNGQVGYCRLANGNVVEEWEFFRSNKSTLCLPEQAQKLIGQSGLSDSQIKQLTQAEIVRRVAPGQPVTMDYRDNRITVTEQPVTLKIIQASCG
ncbi:I78 family peptidase inhibitor [Acinetobacter pragensis]|uniref:I78 family peptidase inhibitor n=1 Tax=Acinetobacter pragensis TaxID=1806892 RepID=UPI0033411076